MIKNCCWAASVCLMSMLLAACLRLGPEYQRPETVGPEVDAYQHAPASVSSPAASSHINSGIRSEMNADKWWTVFNNTEIDRLVQSVLDNNLDIRAATARIREIEARYRQAYADRFPTLTLEGGWQQSRQTVTNPLTGIASRQTQDAWSLSLPVSYEMDLWGRLARAEEAARYELLSVTENRRVLAQSLVSEAILLYLEVESLERRIRINQTSVETFRQSLAVVEDRYRRGLSTVLAVRQARRLLAEAEAVLPGLVQSLGLAQQQLAVLAGVYPETRAAREHPANYYREIAAVPPGLPSDLLGRRPDIRAAEAQLAALNARIGVAKANRFPRIALTASFGYASDDLSLLFKPESELWQMAAGITQPLFDMGRLKAGQEAAQAAYAQSTAAYAKTLLTAFSEVEGALLTREQQLERRKRIVHFVSEARATQEVAQTRYQHGLTDYLSVLEAQQTRYVAEDRLIQVDFAIYANRVRLHRALGGGWDGFQTESEGRKAS